MPFYGNDNTAHSKKFSFFVALNVKNPHEIAGIFEYYIVVISFSLKRLKRILTV